MNPTGVPGMGTDAAEVQIDERAALQAFLDRQRELVVWKVQGCDAAVLQASTSPSGMTPLGIVSHLTEVERSWFRDRTAGEAGLTFSWTDDDPDGEWRVDPDATVEQVVEAYEAECRRCDAAIASLPLEHPVTGGPWTLRNIYLHMIEETARHLGQLDLLREAADGTTGEEPTS